ncbi:amidohydrolase family protein [Marinicella sp. W31]|uniref:metal-dependent hydrolase family protein n=1 Tax=Marinicella sp. W31 TaxID=3023713 RepID=UPI003758293B
MKRILILMLISQASMAENIHCGQVFDADKGRWLENQLVTVEARKFASIEDFKQQQVDIDLSDSYCLPGLMDMHTHITNQSNPRSYLERFQLNAADLAFRGAEYADKTLMAGFTTVRDLGDSFNVSIALKRAIAQGRVKGPRIFTAAKGIGTTGGHADPSNGHRTGLYPDPGPMHGVINGVEDARKAVRKRYQDGADLIKITATGGVLSLASSGDNPQFTEEELATIIEIAKDYGFKVAAHAHGKAGMKRAIEAGVASIEHGTYLDDEIIRLMKKNGTYLVPTLIAGDWVTEKSKIKGYFPDVIARKAATIGPIIAGSFEKAHKAGVNIAFGTDSGVSEHGTNAQEFQLMVDNGMSSTQAIRAATVGAAGLLGQEESLGQIKSGFWADMIAVKANPVDDVRVLENIPFVMKDGQVYKND